MNEFIKFNNYLLKKTDYYYKKLILKKIEFNLY